MKKVLRKGELIRGVTTSPGFASRGTVPVPSCSHCSPWKRFSLALLLSHRKISSLGFRLGSEILVPLPLPFQKAFSFPKYTPGQELISISSPPQFQAPGHEQESCIKCRRKTILFSLTSSIPAHSVSVQLLMCQPPS